MTSFKDFLTEEKRICKECGGGIMRKDTDEEGKPIWKCNNCRSSYQAKTYIRKLGDTGFTLKQEKTIERIKITFMRREDPTNTGYYEYKKWEVAPSDWAGQKVAIVNCVVDRKSAPDSMYSTRGQFFIMPNGSVKGHVYQGHKEVDKKFIGQWTGK